jgi:hypothetical protein
MAPAGRRFLDKESDGRKVEIRKYEVENMWMKSPSLFLLSTFAFLLSSCAGSSHPRLVTPSEGLISPRYLEIYSELHAATLHFPAGVYTLKAVDKIGYYYRAPRKIPEHFGGGSLWREGGIFVCERDPQKLRGYVYRVGTITHVGNFSGVKHAFREQPLASATSDF